MSIHGLVFKFQNTDMYIASSSGIFASQPVTFNDGNLNIYNSAYNSGTNTITLTNSGGSFVADVQVFLNTSNAPILVTYSGFDCPIVSWT